MVFTITHISDLFGKIKYCLGEDCLDLKKKIFS